VCASETGNPSKRATAASLDAITLDGLRLQKGQSLAPDFVTDQV